MKYQRIRVIDGLEQSSFLDGEPLRVVASTYSITPARTSEPFEWDNTSAIWPHHTVGCRARTSTIFIKTRKRSMVSWRRCFGPGCRSTILPECITILSRNIRIANHIKVLSKNRRYHITIAWRRPGKRSGIIPATYAWRYKESGRPEEFHLQSPLKTVREPLDSHGSCQPSS